jgi:hypothetical protein
MPQTVTLVPINHPDTHEPIAAGSKVTMSEEAYNHLRQSGAVAASDEDVKANARDYNEKTGIGYLEGPAKGEGNYTARTGREDTGVTEEKKR